MKSTLFSEAEAKYFIYIFLSAELLFLFNLKIVTLIKRTLNSVICSVTLFPALSLPLTVHIVYLTEANFLNNIGSISFFFKLSCVCFSECIFNMLTVPSVARKLEGSI